ncbi:hypothetical protein [Fictibacillus barbaricus]|uniref:DUF3298 domain-containing protein n=1 Tax=Fictibacillus barbaricus TaxID=182136 RepID=A0ABU1TWJ8_9BACL|nr:hypothetical protein [Fictibacillus barbaricus]MDR7071544.1 hypothetical protein [Fictibacillus barbaricus]
MRRLGLFMLLMALLSGCNNFSMPGSHTIIDWVDFVKWNGVKYDAINHATLADEKYIGKKLGKVEFKVDGNVNNPHYKIKDGDAAFHEKGTVIYSIKGTEELIAVKQSNEINGYRIYAPRGKESHWDFKSVPLESVKTIEIYKSEHGKINEIKKREEISLFLNMLKNSKEDPNFQYDASKGDPTYYDSVLYTNEPIAYKYFVQYDGTTYFWAPNDIAVLPNEIRKFFPE